MNTQSSARTLFRLPAEWEPQSAVQLTWPHARTDWAPYLDDITRTYLEIAEAVTRFEPLVIAADDPEAVRRLLPAQPLHPITILPARYNDTWARDHAFITLVGRQHEARLLDFCFNGWGGKFKADLDNSLNGQLYAQHVFSGQYEDHLDFVLEGGSIESDGEGTIYTTSQCLLASHRNQPLTREQIEEELKRRLHAQRIVWIDHGNLIGDDTDGHIDTIVRCAPSRTLLYIYTNDAADPHYDDLQALHRQLTELAGSADGRRLQLLPLPLPRPIYDGEERLPATYANFLVINGAVIVPTYAQPDLDHEACATIARAFPGREIIPVDSRTIIRQHGSIHCITMQYPEEVKR